ncbi:MAG: cytochrome c biogenesis protein CcsA [Planctomycetota bacterium]
MTLLAVGCCGVAALRVSLKDVGPRLALHVLLAGGLVLTGLALGGHIAAELRRDGAWMPFADNVESLLWLALLIVGFAIYVRLHRPMPGVEPWLLAIGAITLLVAAAFALWLPREYRIAYNGRGVIVGLHRVTSYSGFAAFAIAAVSGLRYLQISKRLKAKDAPITSAFSNLERLERTNFVAVVFGFALLTSGLVTGLSRVGESGAAAQLPKILLAIAVWTIYAVVLHAPLLKLSQIRGRTSAWLSITGFALMVLAVLAVQLVPGQGGGG